MPDLDYLRIAKWILIVLLAGFIGQFGRSFAKHLMEKARLRRERSSPTTLETQTPIDREWIGGESSPQEIHPASISPKEEAKQSKKQAKTLSKQKKKRLKVLKKHADL